MPGSTADALSRKVTGFTDLVMTLWSFSASRSRPGTQILAAHPSSAIGPLRVLHPAPAAQSFIVEGRFDKAKVVSQ